MKSEQDTDFQEICVKTKEELRTYKLNHNIDKREDCNVKIKEGTWNYSES